MERMLVSRIEPALDDALDDLGLPQRRSDSIKRQKYIHLAARHFTEEGDHPLTYSWYKWGINQPDGPSENPHPQTFIADPAGANDIIETSHSDFEDFFKTGIPDLALEDWWEVDSHLKFLQQFYTVYPDTAYQDVYLANVDLLQTLTEIQDVLHDGDNPVDKGTYYRFCKETSALKEAVLSYHELEEHYERLTKCTNLLEDVVMVLGKSESEVIQTGHETAFKELKKLYQELTWLIIASKISIQTATGNNKEKVVQRSERRLSNKIEEFNSEYRQKEDICQSLNLLPDLEDYAQFQDMGRDEEFSETFDKFMKVVDGRATCE